MNILKRTIPALNLQETLIVLAIIGILLLLALPNLMPLITKAKTRTDIRAQAKKVRGQVVKELKKSIPKKDKASRSVGKFGPDRQEILDDLRKITKLTQEQAANTLQDRIKEYAGKAKVL